jgi:hypothetical protein
MLTTYGIIAILVILVVAVLAMVLLAWLLRPSSKPTAEKTEVKTQPIVQRFISHTLKKRAFIVRINEGGYKVIFQQYSNEVINLGGEVTGWQALPDKPVSDSLAGAVEIAQSWVHPKD